MVIAGSSPGQALTRQFIRSRELSRLMDARVTSNPHRAALVAGPAHVHPVAASRAGAAQAEQAFDAALAVARRLRRRVGNGARRVARDDRLLETLDALGERADVAAAHLIVGVDGRTQRHNYPPPPAP